MIKDTKVSLARTCSLNISYLREYRRLDVHGPSRSSRPTSLGDCGKPLKPLDVDSRLALITARRRRCS